MATHRWLHRHILHGGRGPVDRQWRTAPMPRLPVLRAGSGAERRTLRSAAEPRGNVCRRPRGRRRRSGPGRVATVAREAPEDAAARADLLTGARRPGRCRAQQVLAASVAAAQQVQIRSRGVCAPIGAAGEAGSAAGNGGMGGDARGRWWVAGCSRERAPRASMATAVREGGGRFGEPRSRCAPTETDGGSERQRHRRRSQRDNGCGRGSRPQW